MTSQEHRDDSDDDTGSDSFLFRVALNGFRYLFGYADDINGGVPITSRRKSPTKSGNGSNEQGEGFCVGRRLNATEEWVVEGGQQGTEGPAVIERSYVEGPRVENRQCFVDGPDMVNGNGIVGRSSVATGSLDESVARTHPAHEHSFLSTDNTRSHSLEEEKGDDERAGMTVQQAYADPATGAHATYYIGHLHMADGTSLQIGQGNAIHHHATPVPTPPTHNEANSSGSSSDDSYDLNTEVSSSYDPQSLTSQQSSLPSFGCDHQAPPPRMNLTKPDSPQSIAAGTSDTSASPRAPYRCHERREPRCDSTQDTTCDTTCNITSAATRDTARDITQNTIRDRTPQRNFNASQGESGPISGRCPLENGFVTDIVSDNQYTDYDREAPESLNNMFLDVEERMFIGREEQFAKVEQELKRNSVAAISGMGGSGKTTFTTLYADRNQKKYKNGIFFVNASSINTLELNFAELAGPEMLKLVHHPERDIPTSIKLVTAWLMKNSDYLLIFDAVDTPDTLEQLGKQRRTDNFRYIPPRRRLRGHVIITSRLPPESFDLVQILFPVVLEDLPEKDTCKFLWKRVYLEDLPGISAKQTGKEQEQHVLKKLVDEYLPGRLPLNLEQTASFIRQQKLSFGDYLDVVKQCNINKEGNPVGKPGFGDNRKTIHDAFIANFDTVVKKKEEAGVLLNLAALCHSHDIPYSLIVAALALNSSAVPGEKGISDLINSFNEKTNMNDLDKRGNALQKVPASSRSKILELLAIAAESQLVKHTRGGQKFTVHEVIQQQLRLRMKDHELHSTLTNLATVLFYLMKSGDISLGNKRLFMPHAEKCAEHMSTFALHPERNKSVTPFAELYPHLRIKTAFVYACLSSFRIAWAIIRDLEASLPLHDSQDLSLELLGLKARLCVWQNRADDALQYGLQGLEQIRRKCPLIHGTDLSNANLDDLMEYASLRKSCAHALLMQFETNTGGIVNHLAEAMRVFEFLLPVTNCKEEYVHLLMLCGLYHQNKGDRCPQTDTEGRLREHRTARTCLQNAQTIMDHTTHLSDICTVHYIMINVKLGEMTHDAAAHKLNACCENLNQKLGHYHRDTAWAITKMADHLVNMERPELLRRSLELIADSVSIQNTVYDDDSGLLQKGETKFVEGKARKLLGQYREAGQVLEEAERLLEATPKNPACTEIRSLLREARHLEQLASPQPKQHPRLSAQHEYHH